jgi:DNA-binding transcriptional LysR family regulator
MPVLDNVTINQLRAFVAVCDQGSFSGAARKLRRAQSAISHAIKALENAFDMELFERNTRKAQLTAAGRSLLPDARAVISRTEEMKNRAGAIAKAGASQISVAIDAYFPRAHLIDCLRTLQEEFRTAAIDLRITSMQGGEKLVLERVCALAVTIENVPEVDPDAIERTWLCDADMVTVCGPNHPLASTPKPIAKDEFGRHVQIVVTDNQPGAEKTQQGVAGKRQWLVNDLGAKRDLLKAGLGWGHLPRHLVDGDLASRQLVELQRRAWHLGHLTFVTSQRRGYDLSPCESRLVELLGTSEPLKANRSAPRPGKRKNPKARHT